jgi:cobalt/nickel transport system permease protein
MSYPGDFRHLGQAPAFQESLMHIPDGFIDTKTAAMTAGLAAIGVGFAARSVRKTLPPAKVPLLGLTAAFVFAAQMLNFPVAGGTSGHLLGGVLAAVLLGPSAGVLVLTSTLIVQCLLFADGGLLAIGANIFNMGIVGSAGAYGIYWLVRRRAKGLRGQLTAAAFASWCSVVLASTACAAELAFSGTVRWSVAFPAMAGVHMLIGVGEATITTLVLVAIATTRPDLLQDDARRSEAPRYSGVVVYGMLIAVGLALLISPFASHWPDGLEKIAETLGFLGRSAGKPVAPAPMPDYEIPGIGSPVVATALAGALGTIVMFVFAFFLARLVTPKRVRDSQTR